MADQDQSTTKTAAPAYLEMSDEDFLKNGGATAVDTRTTGAASTTEEDPQPDDTQEDDKQGAASSGTSAGTSTQTTAADDPGTDVDPENPDADPEDGAGTKQGEAADRKGGEAEPSAGAKPSEGKGTQKDNKSSGTTGASKDEGGTGSADSSATNQPVDYEASYKELMAPFKANGREIQVKSVDDVRQLMQMGANYNKKMQALKPSMKILKMLENNGLLDESKLSFLIDLDKKSPEAISKLVKDSGVDLMDIDANKAASYKAGTYSVDDKEIELDTVLGEIESTPTFQKTLSIVGKEWDQSSRNAIAHSPQLLKLINTHVERGIFDLIAKEMESARALGRLNGVSDFDAYRQIGDAIQARGGFDHLASATAQQDNQGQRVTKESKDATPNPKKVDDDKLKDKRRAAGTSRSAPGSSGTSSDFNPLAISDEDYKALGAKAHLM